jgi:hypothetical protein
MDHGAFDALTRALAGGVGPRRSAMRLLTGGALAGLAAHLGLGEVTQAKSKKHRKQHGDKKPSGQLHAAGKKHKKHKKHKDKPKKPKDRKLCDTLCRDEGGRCCRNGDCIRSGCCPEEKPCGDGNCAAANECCPFKMVCDTCEEPVCVNGEWECRENCPGQGSICCDGTCVGPCGDGKPRNPETCQCECPEGQWPCPGEVCWPMEECCPGSQRCGPTTCSQPGECCDGQRKCPDGETCVAEGECCPGTGQCQEGCCPEGYYCHPLGSCCTAGPPFFCTCPSGYHSEAGLCVPD